ncbi:helix-turn-helix domain-containing protein [Domibacillus indicus]|uniref:helix-turn-helix domain-containing protein n=1 Tax=Domibacillus indicus TaxID=1437523 RepID=UPI002041C5EA|nr:helix-turn-helix transcriptional regulator [Domibacillus indicus]MCM3789468.1 helix-turn-helix domain-containing protein [Domibacillus indicus]
MFGNRLRELRKEKKLTMKELGKKFSLAESTISGYENGNRKPDSEMINAFADFFEVSTDYLYGRTDKRKIDNNTELPELTAKDERDILRDLEKIINNLESKDGLASFDGHTLDDMDEEDRELLIASLENSMRLAKRMAKQKFTPKKHRK